MRPGDGDRVVYWDSCVFIAWITGELRPPGEQDGIHECVLRLGKKLVVVVTSAFTGTEILVGNMPQEAQRPTTG